MSLAGREKAGEIAMSVIRTPCDGQIGKQREAKGGVWRDSPITMDSWLSARSTDYRARNNNPVLARLRSGYFRARGIAC